ncbi:MAG: response regulator receiver modulated diguanylate cyclase [uncultured bacterium]|uniref:Response regulator receiver modulated diguanylate cyclase n=1 Tax=Berkelbacteria bacterium GW2011_GWA2_38_9 TaxID=1618334 RepID=A0A0G0PLH1_9BACT|nr:MAG: response regulator receiver modulated diguanylate cyclase [uncultured bacterium]KKQ90126.1 MAG: Response regulator receiver modulated diguanylate cyclase [Berkelbacteria bacterium GW2011_GWA2_38_9]
MKILIVDDEKLLLDLYHDILVENGFEVVMTTNSKEGIEIAKREMPDVILLDILMPEMNGFDVAKILKSDDTMKNIPIYLLTNLPEESSSEKAKELGVSGYMMKAMTEPSKLAEEMKNIQNQLKK